MPSSKLNPITAYTLDRIAKLGDLLRERRSLLAKIDKIRKTEQEIEKELHGTSITIMNAAKAGVIPMEEHLRVVEAWDLYNSIEATPLPEEPPEPPKPRTLLEVLEEITAEMEGEFKAEDVRQAVESKNAVLKKKPHPASISGALARLVETGAIERVGERGRGREIVYRRKEVRDDTTS